MLGFCGGNATGSAFRLTNALGIREHDALALVGCSGKTSLMRRLSEENRASRVLIGTTTRIGMPQPREYDHISHDGIPCAGHGITFLHGGIENGKVLPPDAGLLRQVHPDYDLTILECDGSKMLPLKGWAEHEPVVPDFITATVGICVLWPLGLPLSEQIAHRIKIFCEITGAVYGEAVEARHIAAMVSHPDGLFKCSSGRRILFINQIESYGAKEKAQELVRLLPEKFVCGLSRIIAGSVNQNEFEILAKADLA